MVRVYKRKRNPITQSQLNMAIDMLRSGKTISAAAKAHKISRRTVMKYWAIAKASKEPITFKSGYVSRKIFSDDQENALEEYFNRSKKFYAVSFADVRILAYKMAKDNNMEVPTRWQCDQMAGNEWLGGFRRRHPSFTLTPLHASQLPRPSSFMADNIKGFYDKLQKAMFHNPLLQNSRKKYNQECNNIIIKKECDESLDIQEESTEDQVMATLKDSNGKASALQLLNIKREEDIDVSTLLMNLNGDPLDSDYSDTNTPNYPDDSTEQFNDEESTDVLKYTSNDSETLKGKGKKKKYDSDVDVGDCEDLNYKSQRKSRRTSVRTSRIKSKRKGDEESSKIDKLYSALKNAVPALKDEFTTYAEHIANRLRNLDKRSRLIAQHKIHTLLYKAELNSLNKKFS